MVLAVMKAVSVLVIYSVAESLLVACRIQDGSTNLVGGTEARLEQGR